MKKTIFLTVLLAFALMSFAQTKTWHSTETNKSWFYAENWNPSGVPTASDEILIELWDNSGESDMPQVDAAGAVAKTIHIKGYLSEMSHGISTQITVKSGGDLTVGTAATPGSLTIEYTDMDAKLIIEDGGTVTVYGDISNTGQILVEGGGSLTQNDGDLTLKLTPYFLYWSTLIKVDANGTFTLNGDLNLEAGAVKVAENGIFTVENIVKTETYTSIVQGTGFLSYSGTVTVTAGELGVGGVFKDWPYERGAIEYVAPPPPPTWTCGDPLVDTRDSKSYATVQIGTQCWMAENLNIGTMINGSGNQTDNSTIEKYCYDNNTANCDVYGGLYQWDEVMQYVTTEGTQGICPTGWHIPTDAEIKTMEMHFGMSASEADKTGWRGTNEGSKLASNASLWDDGNLESDPDFGTSGFDFLPGGFSKSDGTFNTKGNSGLFWSSSESSETNAWRRFIYHNYITLSRLNYGKTYGHSVRCIRD